ncbi:MAG: primosomal protein N' [Pseudomonadota bacterium]
MKENLPAIQRPAVLRLAVPVPLYQLFDYAPPPEFPADCACIGARFEIKFGRQTLIGICIETDPDEPHPEPKPAQRLLDVQPLLDAPALRLGQWLADYYHHPIGEVLPLLLPPMLRRAVTLDEAVPSRTVRAYRRTRLDAAQQEALAAELKRSPKKRAALEHLDQGPQTRLELLEQGFSSPTLNALLKLSAIEAFETELADPPAGARTPAPSAAVTAAPLILNAQQEQAVSAITARLGTFQPFLLDGVTGSGKTEVYLRVIEALLGRAGQALVLIPEIALTPQTQARFQARFTATACLHSQVADRERLRIWQGCRDGSISVLIGTRSAALLPFAQLGLIIVDEEHDASYTQLDGLRYSARDLAVKRAADSGVPLVLGSATPALESIRNADAGRYQRLELNERAGGARFPEMQLLDIRGQRLHDGLSPPLLREIRAHLDSGAQVLIFINRRGYAPSLICSRCGTVLECPACERPLTYHRRRGEQRGSLQCHHCGRQQPEPERCPACTHPNLTPVGIGTQRSELALRERFPDVTVHRIDRDTARSKQRLEAQFAAINRGQPAILVGTQILAKGHHFPHVTLVALLNADAGLTAPDFRAGERTAQLITQVAGRAGRAERPGQVTIQTLQPEQPLLRALIQAGYRGFARSELERREAAGLPPYAAMLLLRAEAAQAADAEGLLRWLLRQVRNRLHGTELLGPVPAPQPKLANRYRFQLLGLHPNRGPLHALARELLATLSSDAARPHLRRVRWSIDIDPYDSL